MSIINKVKLNALMDGTGNNYFRGIANSVDQYQLTTIGSLFAQKYSESIAADGNGIESLSTTGILTKNLYSRWCWNRY